MKYCNTGVMNCKDCWDWVMNNPYFETYGDCEKAWDEAIAARDKWFIKTIEDRFGDGHYKPLIQIGVQDWQDFKADKEWVEWAESKCPHNHLWNPQTKDFEEDTVRLMCFQCWKDRKEEIGDMNMDRLLSGQEKRVIYDESGVMFPEYDLLYAQDLKTAAAVNAEWVEWVEGNIVAGQNALFGKHIIITPDEWQSRRKEIGI